LNKYKKTYFFSTLAELQNLVMYKYQNYLYTVKPIIYYNKLWNEIFITNKNKICKKNNLKFKFDVKPYFIYFPQFHSFQENDINFYQGFTDIMNLKKFNDSTDEKMIEPLLTYLGIEKIDDYNLKNSSIIQKQIDLIDHYNFEGFAIYYYWFSENTITNNNMIMENVVNKFFDNSVDLKSKKVFFIWANENWSNNSAFGKKDNNTKIINEYSETNFYENANNLLQYFKHDNYLKIDNKPVFFIYHSYLITIEELNKFYYILNKVCIQNLFSGIHIVLNSFHKQYTNFKNFYVNFNYKKEKHKFYNEKKETILNYKKYINDHDNCKKETIQTICFDFNNKPRLFEPNRLDKSTKCIDNTEFDKILFIKQLLNTYDYKKSSDIDNILLINAFNEWGENMTFEPSNKYEYYNMNLLLDYLKC
jgi:hypothetical protein